ncbi:hypothetical protein TWF694_002052 [Orbilia ellipsospora]|uniref:Uncharacterized protein n=1 Tax=Orbilia ellipsospora TaxID=2528407 RepID=A0AAV9X5P8_9PEZI
MTGFLYDPSNPPEGFDPTAITTINFGIRYEPLGVTIESASRTKGDNKHDVIIDEELSNVVHWALVFNYKSRESSYSIQMELERAIDGDTLLFPVRVYKRRSALHLGVFTGSWDDIMDLRRSHPMWGTEYSPGSNNCQHWVARMLISMRDFADSTRNRSFTIVDHTRYDRILDVLEIEGDQVENEFNPVMDGAIIFVVDAAVRAMAGEEPDGNQSMSWDETDDELVVSGNEASGTNDAVVGMKSATTARSDSIPATASDESSWIPSDFGFLPNLEDLLQGANNLVQSQEFRTVWEWLIPPEGLF